MQQSIHYYQLSEVYCGGGVPKDLEGAKVVLLPIVPGDKQGRERLRSNGLVLLHSAAGGSSGCGMIAKQ